MSTIDIVKAAKDSDFGAFKTAFMEQFKNVDIVEGRELLDQLIEAEMDDEEDEDDDEDDDEDEGTVAKENGTTAKDIKRDNNY